MTIPPELAALQRFDHYNPFTEKKVKGYWLRYDDVARAWPKPASGEARDAAALAGPSFLNLPPEDRVQSLRNSVRANADHPADTSALRECLRECVESLAGYRREHNDNQPCDAEKRARTLLAGEGHE